MQYYEIIKIHKLFILKNEDCIRTKGLLGFQDFSCDEKLLFICEGQRIKGK